MIKYLLIVTLISFLSIVEASFRSQAEHDASEESAKSHPGFGAAVFVIQCRGDSPAVSISNGIYIAPGNVLTHSHERMEIGKTFVVSPAAGFENFSCDVNMDLEHSSLPYTIKYNLNRLVKSTARRSRVWHFQQIEVRLVISQFTIF